MNEKILVQIVIVDMKRIKISLSLCAGVFGFWRLFFFLVIISSRVSLQSLRFYSKSQAFFQIYQSSECFAWTKQEKHVNEICAF